MNTLFILDQFITQKYRNKMTTNKIKKGVLYQHKLEKENGSNPHNLYILGLVNWVLISVLPLK